MGFHELSGADNGTFAFDGREDLKRCELCGGSFDKDKAPLNGVKIRKRRQCDISYTHDGLLVVSERFREVCRSNGLTGAIFRPLPDDPGFYGLWSDVIVQFDCEAGKAEFGERCPKCERYKEVIMARISLKDDRVVPDHGFAQTDLWFAYVGNDGQRPLILCGDGAHDILQAANLKGLGFVDEEEGTGVFVPRGLWARVLPRLQKMARRRTKAKGFLPPPMASLRLRSGRVVDDVFLDWSGEVVDGNTPDWPEDGPDFKSEDIVAIGTPTIFFPVFWSPRKWFEL